MGRLISTLSSIRCSVKDLSALALPPPWLLALKRGFSKCLDAYHVVSACISLVLLKTKVVKIALKIA